MSPQPAILQPNPPLARYLSFSIHSPGEVKTCLQSLVELADGDTTVVGIGASLMQVLGQEISGLRGFPAITASGIDIPATPAALWCWLRGDDRGELFHHSRLIESLLLPAFSMSECVDSFSFDGVRDLSGYEDGTENPEGGAAVQTALVQNQGAGMDGSSFVAVQQWVHDFDTWDSLETSEQDNIFGRHVEDNEEFDEAPESAHVKRSAQESFAPEAFMLRHSMPWAEDTQGGLMFVAFGHSFDAFEAVLKRMTGAEDGIQDALFGFSHPVTGSYYWCPPMKDGVLDLSLLAM
jgi:putative iron-dependent peroxidase